MYEESYAIVDAILDMPEIANKKVIAYAVNAIVDQPYRCNADNEIATRFYTYATLEDETVLRFEMKRAGVNSNGDSAGVLLITLPVRANVELNFGADDIIPLCRFVRNVQKELTVGALLSYLKARKLLHYAFDAETHEGSWHWHVVNLLEASQYLPRLSAIEFVNEINAFNQSFREQHAPNTEHGVGLPLRGAPHIDARIVSRSGTFDSKGMIPPTA